MLICALDTNEIEINLKSISVWVYNLDREFILILDKKVNFNIPSNFLKCQEKSLEIE